MTMDGVGTKLLVAEEFRKFDTIGIDLVAMNVNDLLCMGAVPIAFMDYLAVGELDLDKAKEILKGVKEGCELAGCKLVGGETAQLGPMFRRPHWFDIAGCAVGQQVKQPEKVVEGDYLVGIPSSGVHSNGFTTLRKLTTWDEEWLTPTRIYTDEILDNLNYIKACAHITGGGISGNLPRILHGLDYEISFELSPWWADLKDRLDKYPFQTVFNCGWGMILVVENPELLDIDDAQVLGRVV